jgi:hypothetical protein
MAPNAKKTVVIQMITADFAVPTGGGFLLAHGRQPLSPGIDVGATSTPPSPKATRLHLVDFPTEKLVIARPGVDLGRADLTAETAGMLVWMPLLCRGVGQPAIGTAKVFGRPYVACHPPNMRKMPTGSSRYPAPQLTAPYPDFIKFCRFSIPPSHQSRAAGELIAHKKHRDRRIRKRLNPKEHKPDSAEDQYRKASADHQQHKHGRARFRLSRFRRCFDDYTVLFYRHDDLAQIFGA